MLHLDFKINSESFDSTHALLEYAKNLSQQKNHLREVGFFIQQWLDDTETIKVKTSGSTGTPKLIELKKVNMMNSAQATNSYFNLFENTKALLCMSVEYIGGKMMLVRAMLGGWNLDVREASKNPLYNNPERYDFAAMVPYQVFHSFDDLYKISTLIIGGGALSPQLEEKLQSVSTAVFATYGMTETISHIALRSINGDKKSDSYQALSGVRFAIDNNSCLIIDAPSISREKIVTNDVVHLISESEFVFLGRLDNVINSGGVKIYPEKVEKKLAQTLKLPFFIASEKHSALGEQVILIVETSEVPTLEAYADYFSVLEPYEKPKKIYAFSEFLFTDTNKLKRQEILKQLSIL